VWESLPSKDFIGFPRYSHAMVEYNNKLVIFGGICQFGKKRGFLNDVRAYDR
jgi:hypothetical protein